MRDRPGDPAVAQQVKDLLLLRRRSDPWPGTVDYGPSIATAVVEVTVEA